MLNSLADDARVDVRRLVAANANCPPAAFARLSADDDGDVRAEVAANANCPLSLIASLARDPIVSPTAVSRRRCPPALIARLATGRDPIARWYAAKNPNCPTGALVQASAVTQRRLSHIGWNKIDDCRVLAAIAANANTPTWLLARLSRHDDNYVRAAAAANANTPPADLRRLSRSRIETTRRAVAANPACPPRLLPRLANDPATAAYVAASPACPPRLLAEMSHLRPGLQWGFVLIAIAGNPNTPQPVLVQLHASSRADTDRLFARLDDQHEYSEEDFCRLFDPDEWFYSRYDGSQLFAPRIRDAAAGNPNLPASRDSRVAARG